MDSLPSEIATQLFSYFEGTKVRRFAQLSHCYQNLVKTNTRSLKPIKWDVRFWTDKNVHMEISVSRKARCFVAEFDSLNGPPSFKEKENEEFFRFFFGKNREELNLREILEFLLKNVEMHLDLKSVVDPTFFKILSFFCEERPSRIRSVRIDVLACNDDLVCDCLREIARSAIRRPGKPELLIDGYKTCLSAAPLKKINEVAGFFASGFLEIKRNDVEQALPKLARNWDDSPFPKFNFHVRAWETSEICREKPNPEMRWGDIPFFIIVQTNPAPFMNSAPDAPFSYVDIISMKNFIINFRRRYSQQRVYQGVEMDRIIVSIETNLKQE